MCDLNEEKQIGKDSLATQISLPHLISFNFASDHVALASLMLAFVMLMTLPLMNDNCAFWVMNLCA